MPKQTLTQRTDALEAQVAEIGQGVAALLAHAQGETAEAKPKARKAKKPKAEKVVLKPKDGFTPIEHEGKVYWVGIDPKAGTALVAYHSATLQGPAPVKAEYAATARRAYKAYNTFPVEVAVALAEAVTAD